MQGPNLRITALVIVSAVICTPIAKSQANEPSFAGEYIMNGKGYGPDDSPYAGTCSIMQEHEMYEVSCFNQDTQHTYVGKGLAMGQTLAIFIGDPLRGDHNTVLRGRIPRYLPTSTGRASGRNLGECEKPIEWRGDAHTEAVISWRRESRFPSRTTNRPS
jgi:hypothetical protein